MFLCSSFFFSFMFLIFLFFLFFFWFCFSKFFFSFVFPSSLLFTSSFFIFIFIFFHFSSFFQFFLFFIFQSSEQTPTPEEKRRTIPVVTGRFPFVNVRFLGLSGQPGFKKGPSVGDFAFMYFISLKNFSIFGLVLEKCFIFLCFLRSRCSMEMWCPDDSGRDSWDWVEPPAWERA